MCRPRNDGEPCPQASGAQDLISCLAEIARGSEQAFASLYAETSRWVYGVVLRIVRDRQLAEETTIDVYLQIWKSAATYVPARGRVEGWLLSIARSRAIDKLRWIASRRHAELPLAEGGDRSSASLRPHAGVRAAGLVDGPEAPSVAGERRERLHRALGRLPEKQRAAIDLAFFSGLTHVEIAERLDLPLGTVKTQIRLGVIKLRQLLRSYEEER